MSLLEGDGIAPLLAGQFRAGHEVEELNPIIKRLDATSGEICWLGEAIGGQNEETFRGPPRRA